MCFVNPNYYRESYKHPLLKKFYTACKKKSLKKVKIILAKIDKVQPSFLEPIECKWLSSDRMGIFLAESHNHLEITDYLLTTQEWKQSTLNFIKTGIEYVLSDACQNKNLARVKELLTYSEIKNYVQNDNLYSQLEKSLNKTPTLNDLVLSENFKEHTKIHHAIFTNDYFAIACANNDIEIVKKLVESGVNIHNQQDKGIIASIARNAYDVIQYLTPLYQSHSLLKELAQNHGDNNMASYMNKLVNSIEMNRKLTQSLPCENLITPQFKI